MTRGGGSGSRRGRGRRDPGAAHRGWAPLAPPREAPARPGTYLPRGRRAGPRRVATAAAMSPGKPGAGGAGTRRTGWRRRRRRRRLEAVSRAPGIGRTAGPDSRGPGTFQGARGMKPAAREARPPRRLPRLRWALPPLLLLCRLGQVSSRGPSRREGGRGGTGIPGTCPRCPPAGFGGVARAGVLGAPSWRARGNPACLATEPLTRLPRTIGRPAGYVVPELSRGSPRGLQAISGPPFPELVPSGRPGSPARRGRRGRVCRGRPARSGANPACRARGAGPKGSGGGRGAGRAAGRRSRRGASGPRAPLLGKVPTRERGPLAGVLPADRPLPGEVARFPGGLFRAWWAPALPPPPCVLASLFQIMLCLAFW